ncbi:MAG: precorrin-6y C5,15-methyltransferase (decarboxylating) subunit CbiE [Thauera sp.]|jgi:precorrin-6Y C5,15-methyltransferase (decarboxylating)|nr:precorrin-6y C5,15-methyltransferase (decarboxylating) subunit CbiE [Thauera sp.]
MAHTAWLSVVGIGEDGMDGLAAASRVALEQAQLIFGAERHLELLAPALRARAQCWPRPFAAGIERLLAHRGEKVVMLASGDPFCFGAGSVLARELAAHEWQAFPAPSAFSHAAARLGWALDKTDCCGLHAAPLSRLRPRLAPGRRLLVLLRDGAAVAELAAYLSQTGFGASTLHVLEALAGPRERLRSVRAADFAFEDVVHPVLAGIEVSVEVGLAESVAAGAEPGFAQAMPCVSGLADHWFEHDGQLSKQPVRALSLAALAPRRGERLWDIGAGSGSISIEWLLADEANTAIAFEPNPARAARIRRNALRLGVDRLQLVEGAAPQVLAGQPLPDAVFIGGGLSAALLDTLWALLPAGTRIVAHAVTLESEALLADWQARVGGSLLRIELAQASALGSRRGWKAAYPVVQWSAQRSERQ